MSSLTFLQKRDGAEPSRLSDDLAGAPKMSRRAFIAGSLSVFLLLMLSGVNRAVPAAPEAPALVASKTAAARCRAKLNDLEGFAKRHKRDQKQTTKFSEDEVNSYLALDLKSKYHACLKSLVIAFRENNLQATAKIDFDRLGSTSTSFLSKLIGLMFSGVHTLAVDGEFVSSNGIGNFRLHRAVFDDSTLPKRLVEEIITAVGRKQNPPFNPLQPSKMPYEIDRVEVHTGYIIVFQ
jgi:hypothetical protein